MNETEILQAPVADYMNSEQLAFFRARLSKMEDDLRRLLVRPIDSIRDVVSEADLADVASREEEQASELRQREHNRHLFDEVRRALLRMEEGSYGYCEDTGEPIGIARLLVQPTARFTVDAQEKRERLLKLGLSVGKELHALG